MTRRRALVTAGLTAMGGLAGCDSDGQETDDRGTTDTEAVADSATKTDAEATSRSDRSNGGSVPMFRYDPANTGAREDGVGPKTDAEVHWRVELDDAVWSTPAVVDGTVYVASRAGRVSALAADTGDVAWTVDAGGAILSGPAVVDGTAYIGTLGGTVRALATDTGDQRWEFGTDGPVVSSPTVLDERVFVGDQDGGVYAIEAASGDEAWQFAPAEASGDLPSSDGTHADWSGGSTGPSFDDRSQSQTVPVSTPAVVDGTVYVKRASSLFAVSASSGRREWEQPLDGGSGSGDEAAMNRDRDRSVFRPGEYADSLQVSRAISSSPAVVDGTVYVGEYPDLSAVDAESGDLRWRTESASSSSVRALDGAAGLQIHYDAVSSPAVAGGTAFTGGDALSAVSTDIAERDWDAQLAGAVRSSPAVVGDTVYVGTDGGTISALAADSGDERWTLETAGAVISSPAVLDGMLYVGSDDGFVYALTEP